MCGIIACIGSADAAKNVIEGLKRLEYRGYDSWGIAILTYNNAHPFKIVKKVGKIGNEDTNKIVREIKLQSNIAIGHTRWATHGGITKMNCHPHLDCDKSIAVVHNGVIDNYRELKEMLRKKHHKFLTQTDTEVIPHLIEELTKSGEKNFINSVIEAAKMLTGRSAFVVVDANRREIAAVRVGTPLIMGVAPGKTIKFYISSDVSAFLDHTNKVIYIDNNQLAALDFSNNSIKPFPKFFDIVSGQEVPKRIVEIDWKGDRPNKSSYNHFLIKEIMEQKHTIAQAINQEDQKILSIAKEIENAYGVFFVGCGTAGKVCAAAEYLFSKIAEKHVNSVVASEFNNYIHYLTKKTLVVPISQSGETADVLEAIETAKSKGARVISLLNMFGSTMMHISDDFLIVNAGAERAVASTKATTAQLSVVTLLAYATAGKLQEGKFLLLNTAEAVNDMLNPRYENHIKKLATLIKDKKDIFIIGRGINYPMAEEAAIKIQETCLIHAQGFAGGELKHGPLALIKKGTVCIALVANDDTKADILNNASEVKARGGYIVGISPDKNDIFDYWIKVPDAGNASPIVNIIPIQILAYHLAVLLGNNPDYPRNLAKSVTVK